MGESVVCHYILYGGARIKYSEGRLNDSIARGQVARKEINRALAMWLVLVRQQDTMEAAFDDYDSNHNGRLNRLGVKKILTLLNDDIPVTNAEADWVMEATDVDGSGELTRAELRASVALWYFHVVSTAVDPRRG